MDPTTIFLPVSALAVWTLLVLMLIPIRRFRAGFRGQVTTHDFKYGESANVPPAVRIPNRNLMNLLEMPVLFYVASIVLYVSHSVSATDLWLAWTYVALRLVHSLIHLTYNKVTHRLAVYALSNLLLAVLWLRLAGRLYHHIYP